jgi:hypothetical protein
LGSRADENAPAPRPLRVVTPRDLHELYLLAKGSRSSNTLLDAETELGAGNYPKARGLVQSMRDVYYQTHLRTLRADAEEPGGKSKRSRRETDKLRKKQEKIQQILARLDMVLEVLQRMVEREANRSSRSEGDSPAPFRGAVVTPECATAYQAANNPEEEVAAIRASYDLLPVISDEDLRADRLYLLQGSQQTYLVRTLSGPTKEERVALELAISGKRLKAQRRQKLLDQGNRRRLWRLAPKTASATRRDPSPEKNYTGEETSGPDEETVTRQSERDSVLDLGAFTQLLDAAKRSGIVPNADLIGHVRDREFRLGDYQRAYQVIEGLYGKFTAACTQRTDRLRREDVEIASGRKKMSPKELQKKRARDTADTQRIERTRYRFNRVMEGLRVLMQGPRPGQSPPANGVPPEA